MTTKSPLFVGCAAALITPFDGDRIDHAALSRLVSWHIACGTDALVVCGTTGEASTLSDRERLAAAETCVRAAQGRVPVIVGTGSNHTAHAVSLTRDAASAGANGVLVVTPYYNKTTQSGLVRHFTAVADASSVPVILYNVPSRTGLGCTAETYQQLAAHPNINGVKEASGSFSLLQDTLDLCPDDFSVWSGNDEDTVAVMALGGHGVISTAANIIPREMHALTRFCLINDFASAGREQLRLRKLLRALFCEVNPIPVKTAAAMLGLCDGTMRLPLCEAEKEHVEMLEKLLKSYSVKV